MTAALAVPAVASAQGDPIMPLSQVQRGMHCSALSVIHGTDVSSFDTEVLDVIAGDAADDARILVRVSGPAIDATMPYVIKLAEGCEATGRVEKPAH